MAEDHHDDAHKGKHDVDIKITTVMMEMMTKMTVDNADEDGSGEDRDYGNDNNNDD